MQWFAIIKFAAAPPFIGHRSPPILKWKTPVQSSHRRLAYASVIRPLFPFERKDLQ